MTKPFDPHGWVYRTRRSSEVAFDPTLERVEDRLRAHLNALLVRHGGKAFGLKLCELVAIESEHMTVPQWIGIQISDIMYQDLGLFIGCIPWLNPEDAVILRSSAHEEDWMSADSGALMSPVVLLRDLRVTLIDSLAHRVPQIIQKFHEGIGLVVDICWSELLGQPIVRIAAGREYKTENIRRFSSATSDHEGPIVVMDLEGNVVIELQRGEILVDQPVVLPYSLIAKELTRAVRGAIGDKFGVQLELIIHPDQPEEWLLVQIRPTPGRVRPLEGLNLQSEATCVARTAAVSGSFNHTGNARILTPQEQQWLMNAETIRPDDPETFQTGSAMFNGVNVLVWEKLPHPDFGVFQMRMLHRLGTVGQITRNAITMNTSHGKVQRWVDSVAKLRRELVHTCALLGFRDQLHDQLLTSLRDGPRAVEIVSDGLIGEIRLL